MSIEQSGRMAAAQTWVRFGIVGAVLIPAAASAGGYDTGERDWDFLFQQEHFAAEASVRYIHPDRTLSDIDNLGGLTSPDVKEAAAFTVPRFSVAGRLADHARCLGSYREPWGGHADYGSTWTFVFSAIEQHFTSRDYGLTCAISTPLGIGSLSVIGGVSLQEVDYELLQFVTGVGFVTTDVSDESLGWRTGLAFEIPQYAMRFSLIYNSAIDYDMTGTHSVAGSVFGSITMPQSVELKAQSGIAPGWLAFGSIKWTDWSVARKMPICTTGFAPCVYGAGTPLTGPGQVSGLALLWKDTWTVTVGAAHQFTQQFSVAGNLTWDQGGTEGFTSQTDTWVAGLTAILIPHKNLQIRVGGTLGLMTGGSLDSRTIDSFANPAGYTATFGDDLVYTLNASAVLQY